MLLPTLPRLDEATRIDLQEIAAGAFTVSTATVRTWARQVLKHGWFEDPDDCDADVQTWVAERDRQDHPVRFTWQPGAWTRTFAPHL